jgi:hypothetical protein
MTDHVELTGGLKHMANLPLREQLVAFYVIPPAFYYTIQLKKLKDRLLCLAYSCKVPRSPIYKREPMDVDKLVERWMDVVPRLALAHDRDESDQAEAEVEDLLNPILAAPIKQCREFVAKLLEAMKADKRIPWVLWRTLEVWKENFDKAPDQGIKRLKKKLAAEIVELVDPDSVGVKQDIREAMVRALMWRDPEALAEMKEAIVEGAKQGRKPRLKGRESCLFLQMPAGRGCKRKEIML